jgi:hypothetical protein
MKKMNFEQMEIVNGGQTLSANADAPTQVVDATWQKNVACLGACALYIGACASPFGWAALLLVAGRGASVVSNCWYVKRADILTFITVSVY